MPDTPLVPPYPFPKPPIPQSLAPGPELPALNPRQARLWWLALLAVSFGFSNAAVPTAFARISFNDPDPTGLFVLTGGVFVAQMLILSFFAVLGPGPDLPRQGIVWLVAGILIGCYFAPVVISTPINHRLIPFLLVFAFPTVFLAFQSPLWALRFVLRWRTGTRDGGSLGSGQISLRGMLATSFFVAFALGMLRLGYSLEITRVDPRNGLHMIVLWMALGFIVAIALVVSTVVLPVTSLLLLRSKSGVRGVAAAAAYLVGCPLIIILIYILLGVVIATNSGFVTGGIRFPWLAYLIYLTFYLIIAGYLLIALAIFRSAGYRLWWGRPAG